jgi:hypothetical protein
VVDVERVLGYRALRIARADPVMWTKVEFEDYAAAASYRDRPLAGHELHHLADVRRQHGG